MKLSILTPAGPVLEDDVEAVYAKSISGEFGVLPKHVPLVAPLEMDILRYVKDGETKKATVLGGIFKTDGNSVTVICDAAELSEDIDSARAQAAKDRAEARLRENKEDNDMARAEEALARAIARLKAAK